MKKRLISMLLALLVAMGLLPTAAFAASTPEEALGEVQIYNGGVEMSYLSINGRIRSQIYTYYNYDNGSGSTREIPAYCVNPNTVGVPQTVESARVLNISLMKKPAIPRLSVSWPTAIPREAWPSWDWKTNIRATTQLKWPCGVIFSATGTSTTSRSIPT